MYKTDVCLCCGSNHLTQIPALIAPFLSFYALGGGDKNCNLLICTECQFRFFDVRPDTEEVTRLYANYRGERYFEERHRHEFWYSRAINDGIGSDQHEIQLRKDSLAAFLGKSRDTSSIRSVLDYGGDRGQFIPDQLGSERFVYEISDAVPVEGVSRIESEAELAARRYDLVMICGVLEHMSDPAEALRTAKPLVAPERGLVYIEVPFERPSLALVPRNTLYRAYLNALQRTGRLLELVDFLSTAFKLKLNFVPPFGFIKMHEHVNFFSQQAMAALVERNGFSVIASEVRGYHTHAGTDRMLSVLASSRSDR